MWAALPARRAYVALVLILALAAAAAGVDVVSWREAGEHVGNVVTLEGDVVAAHVESGALRLAFAPDDPHAVRVVLVLPMFSDLPRQPQRLYLGKRIRATGTVRRLGGGAPEMVLRSPSAIEIVDVAGPESAATTPPAPAAAPAAPSPTPAVTAPPASPPTEAAAPSATATAPTPAAPAAPAAAAASPGAAPSIAAAPSPTTPPTPAATPAPRTATPPPSVAPAPADAAASADEDEETTPPTWPRRDPCPPARERWQAAATALRARLAALDRCLAAGAPPCRDAAAAVAPALTDLEWAEQRVADDCP